MTSLPPRDFSPEEMDEIKALLEARLEAMTPAEAAALLADRAAMEALSNELMLRVGLKRLNAEELVSLRDRVIEDEPSVFTDGEWDLMDTMLGSKNLRHGAQRSSFEALMRSDPAALQTMKHRLADIQRDRSSSLSPMAKQWLIRIAVGLGIGLIALAMQQN
jgi:hypothetical protein